MKVKDLGALEERVRVKGRLRAETALRVGGVGSYRPTESDIPVVKDSAGMPYIPGSSLKGILRSTIEALVRGLGEAHTTGEASPWSCDPLEAPCNDRIRSQNEGGYGPKTIDPQEIIAASCDACLLFGNMSMAGRILIADLPLVKKMTRPPVEVRDHVAIDRDTETAKKGGKYDHEVVLPGTAFALDIVLDNPTAAQIGLLAAGINALNEGWAALGGSRTRGLGRVSITVEDVTRLSAEEMLGLAEPPPVTWEAISGEGRAALAQSIEEGRADHV